MSSYKSGIKTSAFRGIPVVIILTLFSIKSNSQTNSSENTSLGSIFNFSSNISASETWTDNISLSSGVKKSGWISTVSPGLNLRSTAGKIKGNLNYSLNFLNYSDDSNKNSLQNSLNSSANIEIIDGHGYVDLNGVIYQQTISAFSIQTNNLNGNSNSNKTEVSSYSISPYYKGRLSRFLTYEARHRLTTTKAKNLTAFSSDDSSTSLNISSNDFFGKLSWGLGINNQVMSRSNNSDVKVLALNTSISYPIFDNVGFSLSAGRQNQNYSSANKESSWTSGAGVNWSVSETTKLSANIESNPLGKMHGLNFEHRTPRTSWRVSDIKSVSLSNGKNSLGSVNNFDLLFNQFSSIEPDINKRALLVNNYMLLNGISATSTSVNGYLTSGTSVQRTQNISFAVLGIRDTITLTATRGNGRKVGLSFSSIDDFNNSNSIKQEGFSVSYTHRLTEDTVLSNQLSRQETLGDINSQRSKVNSINVTASTRLSPKSNLSFSARHSISSSMSFPYKETAITGNLAVQF
jgi:uncharacterized protein (PEP-CTERM system associated)